MKCICTADYSPAMEQEFCGSEIGAENVVPNSCHLPSATARDTPTLGNSLLQWSAPSDASARSFRYNQFISRRIATAISSFAAVIKNVSNNRAFTMAFNGYLFDLSDSRLTYSGHLALSQLLQCPHLDAIASPYRKCRCLLQYDLIAALICPACCRVRVCTSATCGPVYFPWASGLGNVPSEGVGHGRRLSYCSSTEGFVRPACQYDSGDRQSVASQYVQRHASSSGSLLA